MYEALPGLIGAAGLLTVLVALRRVALSRGRSVAVLTVGVLVIVALSAEFARPSSTNARVVASLLMAVLLLLLSRRSVDRVEWGRPRLFFAGFVLASVWMFAVNVVLAPEVSLTDAFGRLVPVFIGATLYTTVRTGYLDSRHVGVALSLGFGAILLWSGLTDDHWAACTQFKCGPAGQLFVGPFVSENSLARVAGFQVLVALWMGRRAGQLLPVLLAASGVVTLVLTGSRTSQLALALALAMWVVCCVLGGSFLKKAVSAAMPGALVVLGLHLVYGASPSDFSNRGAIWLRGADVLGADWLGGAGLDNWSTQVLARNYMHSQGLLLLYGGGVIAVAAYTVMLTSVMTRTTVGRDGFAAALGVFVLISGLVEVVWNPLAVDGSVVTLLMLIATFAGTPGDDRSAGRRESSEGLLEVPPSGSDPIRRPGSPPTTSVIP